MNDITKQVEQLDIRPEFKGMLSELISAELFSAIRQYKPTIFIEKSTNSGGDLRVWVKVSVMMENKSNSINLFWLRPFTDSPPVYVEDNDSLFTLRKTYFLYDEDKLNGLTPE